MVILDVAIVNVALPSIDAGLHFSPTGLQWVVNAYTVTFAGFLMLGLRVIPESRRVDGSRHFDVAGGVLVTAALVSVTLGIVRTDTLGWSSAGVLVPLVAGIVLLGAFFLVETRFAEAPLVPMSIFRI